MGERTAIQASIRSSNGRTPTGLEPATSGVTEREREQGVGALPLVPGGVRLVDSEEPAEEVRGGGICSDVERHRESAGTDFALSVVDIVRNTR